MGVIVQGQLHIAVAVFTVVDVIVCRLGGGSKSCALGQILTGLQCNAVHIDAAAGNGDDTGIGYEGDFMGIYFEDEVGYVSKDYIEAECKDAYWVEEDMKVALNVIRNCFSHLERIYLGPDRKMDTTIILSDYDTKGKKSGEVITTYADLIYMLSYKIKDFL